VGFASHAAQLARHAVDAESASNGFTPAARSRARVEFSPFTPNRASLEEIKSKRRFEKRNFGKAQTFLKKICGLSSQFHD